MIMSEQETPTRQTVDDERIREIARSVSYLRDS